MHKSDAEKSSEEVLIQRVTSRERERAHEISCVSTAAAASFAAVAMQPIMSMDSL